VLDLKIIRWESKKLDAAVEARSSVQGAPQHLISRSS